MKRSLIAGLFAATLGALLTAGAASADPAPGASGLKIVQRIPGPDGGWDYVSFDAPRRRVYISHGTEVVVIDADTGKLNPAFAPGARLHAVVPVPRSDLLVTTNSGDSTAKIISAADGHLIASVPASKDTDGAVYDPATGLVVVICGDSGNLDLLDPKAAKMAARIAVGEDLEFGATDGKGRFYVDEVGKNAIAVIDLAARKVVATYPLAGCQGPTGLAYVTGGRLIAACATGMAKIIAAATGKEIASLPIGAGPDAVFYDAGRKQAYIPSGRTGTLAVIALAGPGDNTIIDTVATQKGARTGTVDPKTGRIYLPTAEYGPPPAPGQRPAILPGSFQVLVLDRG